MSDPVEKIAKALAEEVAGPGAWEVALSAIEEGEAFAAFFVAAFEHRARAMVAALGLTPEYALTGRRRRVTPWEDDPTSHSEKAIDAEHLLRVALGDDYDNYAKEEE